MLKVKAHDADVNVISWNRWFIVFFICESEEVQKTALCFAFAEKYASTTILSSLVAWKNVGRNIKKLNGLNWLSVKFDVFACQYPMI